MNKKLKKNKHSLIRDYLVFAAIVFLLIVVLCAGFTRFVYISQIQERKHRLEQETIRIENTLLDSFNYISYLVQFIGKQIALEHPHNLKKIAGLLSTPVHDAKIRSVISRTGLDWVTPEGAIIITSSNGILKKPVDLSMRSYIREVKEKPWQLIIGDLTFGRTSAQWILSSAMGITDVKGKYLGAISLGFDIQALTQKLKHITTNNFPFIVLNKSGEVVLYSSSTKNEKSIDTDMFSDKHHKFHHVDHNSGEIDPPVTVGNIKYSYYQKLSGYPYTIVMGYNTQAEASLFNHKLLPLLGAFGGIGFIFIMILHILAKRVITPIKELSDIADKISKGKTHSKFPRGGSYEVYNLSVQISKIKRYINRIRRFQKRDSAKSEILVHVSHELRTPLNAIINFSEIQKSQLYGPIGNSKYLEYSQDIHNAGIHLLQLIDNVLDISKVEADKIDLNEEYIDLFKLMGDCIRTLRERSSQQGVNIRVMCQPKLPLLYADPLRIKQILLNLLTNAVKFSDAGAEIIVSLCLNVEHQLIIKIEDHGIGIPEQDLGKVMEKFGQVNSFNHKSRGGTGLGLPLTKSLIELHQGIMILESVENKGTTITIYFPKERIFTEETTKKTVLKLVEA